MPNFLSIGENENKQVTSVTRCRNKSSTIFHKVAREVATIIIVLKRLFSQIAIKSTIISVTYERKVVHKTFQK